MSDLVMTPVSGKRGINDFLEVPFALYKDDPNWVAPLYLERYDHLNPKKNPYFKHAEAQLFVASRGGKPVGRISAQLCQLHQARYQDKAGQFGFFECEDNDETARALFNAAAGWLKGKGMDKMRGPYNFSINDEMGLLVDGYDTPPNMFMGHGLPRYPAMVERLGFAKAKDVIAYYTNHTGDYPPVLKRISQRALKSGEVKLRPLERKHLKRDIRIIMDIFNDAWSENWGFVPFTEDELEKLGNDMKLLVTDDYVVIAELNGEPVAFSVFLPNINEWIRDFKGRLLPFNWAKLATSVLRKRPTSIRMPLMGVRKKFHDKPLGSAMAVAIIDKARDYQIKRGVKECEMSWILEDNHGMRHIIESVGGKPYKTYRIYEKGI
ncbi:MAG: dATP pyrophosphohydrolase [Hyphomicrobiales bacterium]